MCSDYSEKVAAARAWLSGYVVETQGVLRSARVETDSAIESHSRMALAQLLIDGDAPQEILDLLAVLIAPDANYSSKNRTVGVGLYRTGSNEIDLALDGAARVIYIKYRDKRPRIDPVQLGSVLGLMSKKISEGSTIQRAADSVSEELESAGIHLEPRTVKGYWDELKWHYSPPQET